MEFYETNHKDRLPYEHYLSLFHGMNAGEAAERTGVPFDGSAFTVTLLHARYRVSFSDYEITPLDADRPNGRLLLTSAAANIIVMRYLLEGKASQPGEQFLAYRDMPWGSVYERNFQGRCILRLARGFGYAPEKFERGMEMLGALRVKGGDVAYSFEFMPGYVVRFILWVGDEEFAPSAQILFNENFPTAFTAEDMAVVGDLSLDSLKAAVKLL